MRHARADYQRIQDPSRKIPDDEPVLLIRGQDRAAPDTARHWANLHDALGGDPALSAAVRAHAEFIEDWQAEHGSKVADVPSGVL
jgi:hypothetical protein